MVCDHPDQDRDVPAELYLNVAVSGLLTGLIYGLSALGLSVIFGVIRIVNFAHGEIMVLGMFATLMLFRHLGIDPLLSVPIVAAALFAFGYVLQDLVVRRVAHLADHMQFLLMAAIAVMLVNLCLMIFGPDAQGAQVSYAYDSFAIGPLLVDKVRVYAGIAALVVSGVLFAFFQYTATGKAIRACGDNRTGALVVGLNVRRLYALTFGIGTALPRCGRRHHAASGRRASLSRPVLHAACLHHRHHRRHGQPPRRASRRRADRCFGSGRGPCPATLAEECLFLRAPHSRSSPAPAGPARKSRPMINRMIDGVSPRALTLLAVFAAAMVVAPFVVNSYILSVLIIVLYFAYVGQAWNLMLGFAGQLSLGHALFVGIGAYTSASLFIHFGIPPWAGVFASIAMSVLAGCLIGYLGFRFSIRGVYFALLTIAFAEFTGIIVDHIGWLGSSSGLFLPVKNLAHDDLPNLRGSPMMFYYVILAADRRRASRFAAGC